MRGFGPRRPGSSPGPGALLQRTPGPPEQQSGTPQSPRNVHQGSRIRPAAEPAHSPRPRTVPHPASPAAQAKHAPPAHARPNPSPCPGSGTHRHRSTSGAQVTALPIPAHPPSRPKISPGPVVCCLCRSRTWFPHALGPRFVVRGVLCRPAGLLTAAYLHAQHSSRFIRQRQRSRLQ